MKAQEIDELTSFHAFVGEKLKNGAPRPSPEEVVDEWRDLHPEQEVDEEELAAIQEAIADMEAGDRGRPIDEVLAEIRKELNLPSD